MKIALKVNSLCIPGGGPSPMLKKLLCENLVVDHHLHLMVSFHLGVCGIHCKSSEEGFWLCTKAGLLKMGSVLCSLMST